MRLNRGTLTLLVGSALVIIAVLIFTSTATAPESATPTPTGSAGPLFPGIDSTAIARLTLTHNITGDVTTLVRDEGGAWSIPEATYITDRAVLQDQVNQTITDFAGLEASDSFSATDLSLEDFGLNEPSYILTAQATDGTTYTLYVGHENPGGNRYYVIVTTAQGEAIVMPTALPTAEATEAATEAAVEPEAEATDEAEAAEATEETADEVEAEATEAAVEPEADATDEAEEAEAEATEEESAAQEESAEEAVEATAEATEAATAEVTAEPTYDSTEIGNEGQTIFLVNSATLDNLVRLIETPPYVPPPTSTPTPFPTANPYSEVEQTATAVIEQTATAEFGLTATAEYQAILTAIAEPLVSTLEVTEEAGTEGEPAEEVTPTPTATP